MHTKRIPSICAIALGVLALGFGPALCAQQPQADASAVMKAIDLLAQGKRAEAIPLLEKLSAETPNEEVFYSLGHAYMAEKRYERAAAAFEDGAARFPLSARLWYNAGIAYEQGLNLAKALANYRRAVALDALIVYTGGSRYDPEFDAIYIPIVHDHRGMNACAGRLYIYPDKMHFVVYHVVSGMGPGNDDSFETPYTNISSVEVDRKKGEQAADYSIITLLTNQSGPRRRIASGEESRVDLKFTFKQPISGYRGGPWTKNDIKFFFIETESGERMMKFLETKDLKPVPRGSK